MESPVLSFLGHPIVSQHDNDLEHASRLAIAWFRDQSIEVIRLFFGSGGVKFRVYPHLNLPLEGR